MRKGVYSVGIWLMAVAFSPQIPVALAAPNTPPVSESTYGNLYVAEDVMANQGHFDLGLSYGSGLGVPQYTLSGVTLNLEYWGTDLFVSRLSIGRFRSTPTTLQSLLNEMLDQNQVALSSLAPETQVSAHLGFSPLHGLLNILGRHVVSYDLIFGAGVGGTKYNSPLPPWAPALDLFVEQKFLLSTRFGVNLGYTQFWEHYTDDTPNSVWLNRGVFEAGVYVRF